ncbi:MAG: hypothetical protein EON94_01075 [Caulobacteraceae bacterium]|nr:MAG: hypothetical protein EON94_01075 [Caulobacteraceae bacterium]
MMPGTMFGARKARLLRRMRRSKTLLALGLTGGFVFTAWLGLNVLYYKSHAPANWMATSFMICAMVMLTGRLRLATVAACMAGAMLMAHLAKWPWLPASLLSVLTLIESMLGAWLLRRLSQTPRLPSLNRAIRLLTTVMLPSLALTTGAALVLIHLLFRHQGFEKYANLITTQWLAGHGMGMIMMLPTILLLMTPAQTKPPRKSLAEQLLLTAIFTALALAPFTPLDAAAQFMVLPIATIFAFRLGPKLTVISILVICTVDQVDCFLNPDGLLWGAQVGRNTKILAGQIFLVAVYANAVFTGLAIDYQARVKRMLTRAW